MTTCREEWEIISLPEEIAAHWEEFQSKRVTQRAQGLAHAQAHAGIVTGTRTHEQARGTRGTGADTGPITDAQVQRRHTYNNARDTFSDSENGFDIFVSYQEVLSFSPGQDSTGSIP